MWITIAQFILSLSILIVLHELGHFTAAKWFKTRVEKFYLFFNPYFSLFKVQYGETEYGLGWLPLGGYVKISGMIDESFDTDQMSGPPQPYEFRSKPAWQRLIIMVGGVTVNFILGIVLFAIIAYTWGESYLPNDQMKEGIAVTAQGYELGLREGDKLLMIGQDTVRKFSTGLLNKNIIVNSASDLTVLRNGRQEVIKIDPKWTTFLSKYENRDVRLAQLKMPGEVAEIVDNSPAEPGAAGLRAKDIIIAVNGDEVNYQFEFVNRIMALPTDSLPITDLTVKRGIDTLTVSYNTLFDKKKSLAQKLLGKDADKRRRLGFDMYGPDHYYKFATQKYALGPSIGKGWNDAWGFLVDQVNAFGQMLTGKIKAKDSLGSFITIGKLFGSDWDWHRFWNMTASLSILLGFFNLLPIPALDGGYVMFLLYETITGRKVSDSVMEKSTMIGFFILIGFMIYALFLDIMRQL